MCRNRNGFSKRVRLLNESDFSFVFQRPIRIKMDGVALFSRENKLGFSRVGLAISKKYIDSSCERNRIKRHIRETFRINQYNLLSSDFVATIYSKEIVYLTNYLLNLVLKKLWYRHFLF